VCYIRHSNIRKRKQPDRQRAIETWSLSAKYRSDADNVAEGRAMRAGNVSLSDQCLLRAKDEKLPI
jgi:hypothetical protein